jgi:histidyl-tRNA synthetase
MKIPPVKGTRDFYPQDMAVRNWIIDGWKKVSLRNGFEEYDGPIFEYLDMYRIKSGDEIVEQLFSLKDRGGRDLALRPEITPTLARMVNQQINSLPKPIKWFSVPRLFRAERPQKGRLREFFQWNIDVIGVEKVLADAETIFCALDYLREAGLTPDDIVVKISSRKMLAAVLRKIGVAESKLDVLYTVLDKRNKLPDETFRKMLGEQVADSDMTQKILDFIAVENMSDVCEDSEEIEQAKGELIELVRLLDVMGVGAYCKFDTSIVRGLAYYTGIVYEIYDKGNQLRAIGGGGRYDDLLKQFGGLAVPATGFGIGDCVLGILLEEKGLLKPKKLELDYFVALADKVFAMKLYEVAAKLRSRGFSAVFSYESLAGLSKQLKEASSQNTKYCIIIGDEFNRGDIVLKNMSNGQQKTIPVKDFLENPAKFSF